MTTPKLGVCYYPEHWHQTTWQQQAEYMREGGIELVRIAEFAWSRIEPEPGSFDWKWLDEAIDTLAAAGLNVVMCTPTACPPQWLIEQHPEILPVDETGRIRHFGSRRHYRFASEVYREESRRITTAVVQRYADHPAISGWQLDNEYGCHETILSYSEDDLRAFRGWLQSEYADIGVLNEAWGTVFWSQEYRSFDAIGLPNLTVTEANPAHRLAYWRFASDQVVQYNREQVDILRNSPARDHWLSHNFMGNSTEFDHYAVAADIDVATWDSYPIGFLDQGWFTAEEKRRYRRIGHPDWAGFHHDLYRAVGNGRFGVIEQQPGPVNWAPNNALPLESAPAYWAMEAIAHGAELVSYFRFQQLPVAQEQMHAALRLPDGSPAPAWQSLLQLRDDLHALPDATTEPAPVALLFDYPSCWSTVIQPHVQNADHIEWVFTYYSALRSLGVDIDIVHSQSNLDSYKLVVVPSSVFVDSAFVERVQQSGAASIIGPRSGSRDGYGALPNALAPGNLQSLVPLRVTAVDGMRPGVSRACEFGDEKLAITRWFEVIESELSPRLKTEDGYGLWYSSGGHHYLNGFLECDDLRLVLAQILDASGIAREELPDGLRLRRRGDLLFVLNAGNTEQSFEPNNAQLICGKSTLAQGEYGVWLDTVA